VTVTHLLSSDIKGIKASQQALSIDPLKYYVWQRGRRQLHGKDDGKRVGVLSKTTTVILITEVQRRELPVRCLA